MTGTRYTLEVQPNIPERLKGLEELANDLFYSWDRTARGLFFRLDRELWEQCGHNPKVFLRRVAQERLEEAANDQIFLESYNRALSAYNTYHWENIKSGIEDVLNPDEDLIAYFCAEFGFHESLPIYSGGLGILAGDHCKAASDLALPFIAVGMLYRQGYFTQTVDGDGKQVAHHTQTHFSDLPITPAYDTNGKEVRVSVHLPGREVMIRVWRAKAGRIELFLLDTDLAENQAEDRRITYQLYGGGKENRIQQEIVLGIGGVRAIRALGYKPSVWHINEGHPAFQILERCNEWVTTGLDFDSALEVTAACTVFTTHTPVPAGHDMFDHDQMVHYFGDYIEKLGIPLEKFLQLGTNPTNHHSFNMTAFALRGSRAHNGVSEIHGGIASQMEGYVWPQIPANENPMGYVTNGVHVSTFLAGEWANLFNMRIGGEWRNELLNPDYWERIEEIPDHSYWSLHQSLKAELLQDVQRRVRSQHIRNGTSHAQIERIARCINPEDTNILTLGFARRFATYKRATLLFRDPQRLAAVLNNPERPIVMLFAGKAHPNDVPGQHLIQVIHEFSMRPEFEGRIILLEGYDLSLGRKLVTGVDVWVNNPEFPMEASGTSGQKAGMNGVINLSVLDGWWGEGYNGENGWAITPHGPQYSADYRDEQEFAELISLLEEEVAPSYYDKSNQGYSESWIHRSKASMKSLIHAFNAQRMVKDYVLKYYDGANKHGRALEQSNCNPAVGLAKWKQKIRKAWPAVSMQRNDDAPEKIKHGELLPIRIAVQLGDLSPEDVILECLVGTESDDHTFVQNNCHALQAQETADNGATIFQLNLQPSLSGLQYYKFRLYPHHQLLKHRFEMGCMLWL